MWGNRPTVVRISKQQQREWNELREVESSNRSSISVRSNQVQPGRWEEANTPQHFQSGQVLTITRTRLIAIIATAFLVVLLGAAGASIGIILSRRTTISTSTTTGTTATSVTTTSATTSTMTATTTTSVTTATTSTSTSTSTSTTGTTTTTSTTTSTTTPFDSCSSLQWNQTGIRVAGANTNGHNANELHHPGCVQVDANYTIYICDTENNRIQQWTQNATTGTTIAGDSGGGQGSTSILLKKPQGLVFDRNGFLYVADHDNDRVQRFPPNSNVGTTVAGQGGTGSGTSQLKNPSSVVVDDDLNLYVVDTDNTRVVKWAPNATNGIVLIQDSANNYLKNPFGILLVNGSSDEIYMSAGDNKNNVQLWTFGAQQPNLTIGSATLNKPQGILFDPYANLYVADSGNNQIQMFCANSNASATVIGSSGGQLNNPTGIAFDLDLNLYVANTGHDEVLKFFRL